MSDRSFEELFACGPGYNLWTAGSWNPAGKLLPAFDPEPQKGDVSPEHWAEHARGHRALIVSPTLPDRTAGFGVIDVDPNKKEDRGPQVAVKLLELLHEKELPFAVCESKSNGAHAYIFFEGTELVQEVHKLLQHIVDRLDIKRKFNANIDLRPSPSQSGGGTQIQLPYFGEEAIAGAHSPRAMPLEGRYLSREEFVEWCNLNAIIDFPTLRKNVQAQLGPIRSRTTLVHETPTYDDMAKDGPPCFEHFLLEEPGQDHSGHRDELISHLSTRLVMMFPDDWEEVLHSYNLSMDKPLPTRDVDRIIRQQKSTSFGPLCTREFVAGACNKEVCVARRFGVLARNTATPVVGVDIAKIIKFRPPEGDDQTKYPVHIYIEGREGYVATDQNSLVSIHAFAEAIFHRYKFHIPDMKPKAFKSWINEMLGREGDRFFEEPMPREMTMLGRFERAAVDHFNAFLHRRGTIQPDSFIRGTVYWDDNIGCIVFDAGVFADAVRRTLRDNTVNTSRINDMLLDSQLSAPGTRPYKARYEIAGRSFKLTHLVPRLTTDEESYPEDERDTLWFTPPEVEKDF